MSLNKDEWDRLSRGRTIGKRIVMPFDRSVSAVDIFSLDTDDENSMAVKIVLCNPQVLPLPTIPNQNIQTLSGEFDNDQSGAQDPNFAWRPLNAIIEWGAGGVHAKVIADFVNGSSFCLSGSSFRVKAALDPTTLIGNVSSIYVLRAFISPSTGGGETIAQKTIDIGPIPGGGGATPVFPVPLFAKRVSFTSRDISNTINWQLRFFADPGGVNEIAAYVFNGGAASMVFGQSGVPLAIPNGAQFFRMTSVGAPASTDTRLVFDLAI